MPGQSGGLHRKNLTLNRNAVLIENDDTLPNNRLLILEER
jgi:hypothetical protein